MASALKEVTKDFANSANQTLDSFLRSLYLPRIGLPTMAFGSVLSKLADKAIQKFVQSILPILGVPLFATTFSESKHVEASMINVLNSTDGVVHTLVDNVCPQPRTFNVQGYIGGGPGSPTDIIKCLPVGAEITRNILSLMGSGAPARSTTMGDVLAGKAALQALLLMQKKYINFIADTRCPFSFTTNTGEVLPALIIDYSISDNASSQYTAEINLTIREFITMTLGVGMAGTTDGGLISRLGETAMQVGTILMKSAHDFNTANDGNAVERGVGIYNQATIEGDEEDA